MQPEWEEMAATSCAVQNLWLMGTALGVAGLSCFSVCAVSQAAVRDGLSLNTDACHVTVQSAPDNCGPVHMCTVSWVF